MTDTITLAHGSGGKQTSELIGSIFKSHFDNEFFTPDDAAVLPRPGRKLAMSTDGFIVSPWEYPGGNIGRLSICGTVNDLSCMGAKPLYMTCGIIIEEGFKVCDLEKIASSMAQTAGESGVNLVAGDTKVTGKGQSDGVFITTTGIGEVMDGVSLSGAFAKPGDSIIITGDVGRHGAAILIARDEYGIQSDVTSDCAPLWNDIRTLLEEVPQVNTIRDATRGGVGTVLYEITSESGVGMELDTENIPISDEVKGISGMLGLEPLYLACEGRMVVIVPQEYEKKAICALSKGKYTKGSCVIGHVTKEHAGRVVMNTQIGAKTFLPEPGNELLPRIC